MGNQEPDFTPPHANDENSDIWCSPETTTAKRHANKHKEVKLCKSNRTKVE